MHGADGGEGLPDVSWRAVWGHGVTGQSSSLIGNFAKDVLLRDERGKGRREGSSERGKTSKVTARTPRHWLLVLALRPTRILL